MHRTTPLRSTPSRPARRRRLALGASTAVAAVLAGGAAVPANAAPGDTIAPQPGVYGYYVDTYRANTSTLQTPETNPAIGVLDTMLDYWTPGETYDTGTILMPSVLDANIQRSIDTTRERSDADAAHAYLIDRRHQSYSSINGLGPHADAFRTASNAGTTIPDTIPADATTVRYDDAGNSNGAWADVDSDAGSIVTLVNTARGSYATSNNAKAYYNYARPFRWSDDVEVLPTLMPVMKPVEEAETDGGYPSGHTNAAYLASYALAAAFPERYSELVTSASDLGDSRIVAGMHSPADVIGGRILATAIAASVLNDPANDALLEQARAEALNVLEQPQTGADDFADADANRALFEERLTYGLPRVGDTTLPVVVPKGAEALIESRFPYLTDDQRRWVLQSTGIESGYALLDDSEGWGRLNTVAAAEGYAAFDENVAVTMDAAAGGFSALDEWSNDITGAGSLTKDGSGELILSGDNTYTGGTVVDGGALVAANATALGAGDLQIADGELYENADTALSIGGDLEIAEDSTLSLTSDASTAAVTVAGEATLGGTLALQFDGDTAPGDETLLVEYGSLAEGSSFTSIVAGGLPAGFDAALDYRADGLYLVNAAAAEPEPQPEPGDGETPAPAPGTGGDTGGDSDGTTPVAVPGATDDDGTSTGGALANTGASSAVPGILALGLALLLAGAGILSARISRIARRGDLV
ncbi:phosphatase PAP2 family protein [Marisediminicola sp. LYQ134]|uniref:phosphatase PAP2 family protein n=1 Tax=Marisediminicola sp. LYQ134 TaxID=3391061 RepID=UPI003983DA7F